MKYYLIILFNLTCLYVKPQSFSTDDIQLIAEVDRLFKENHIEYQKLFPEVRKRFSYQLLCEIDAEARILTDNEANKVKDLLVNFDINDRYTREKLERIREILKSRINATQKILNTIDEIDFYQDDSVFFSLENDTTVFSNDEEELKKRWIRFFKFEILLKSNADSTLFGKTKEEINAYLNNQLSFQLASSKCFFDQLGQDVALSKYVLQAYLKAYCQSFDPHSDYFSPQEENTYNSSLSSESYGTGIRFSKSEHKLYISEIIPFSYASFNEKLSVGDEITRVFIDHTMISPACISYEKLNEFFYGDRNTEIEFEVKSSKDFKFRDIKLKKSIVNNSFNHTFSFILESERAKIGYVQFPSFYAPFTIDGRSSSEDLALILLELKKNEVSGIIVDLRNNGGGSINEASDLLGYFIDYGPLFTVEDRENPQGQLLKDTKRGKVIDSKLIFLVNSLSASASELVTATMQKYPGSLIVGSPTFGKATGQILIPVKTKYARKNQGTVSITTIKTYRFDGTNFQGAGVIPDIILPSIITKSLASEEKYLNALQHNVKRKFRQIKYRNEPIDTLRLLSENRNSLINVENVANSLNKKLTNSEGISLDYEKFENPYLELQNLNFEVHNSFQLISMEHNEAFLEESERIKLTKEKDVILKEVFQIFEDWITITDSN